jgi:hypothetical protein
LSSPRAEAFEAWVAAASRRGSDATLNAGEAAIRSRALPRHQHIAVAGSHGIDNQWRTRRGTRNANGHGKGSGTSRRNRSYSYKSCLSICESAFDS